MMRKKQIIKKLVMIVGTVFLSMTSTYGQQIDFSIKEAIESLARENQCRYCPSVYQFTSKVSKMTNLVNSLQGLSGKKRQKRFRRLQKSLDDFMMNSKAQHRGLAKELALTKGKELGSAMKDLIKLQTYVETVTQLLKRNPELVTSRELKTVSIKLDVLYEKIDCILELKTPSK